ncbi:MAG TPA: hypothetical protein VM120_13930 [Bryobacteraceae bacterium]|nr:hypothetical protein [Bryobacteraceae bacterium]
MVVEPGEYAMQITAFQGGRCRVPKELSLSSAMRPAPRVSRGGVWRRAVGMLGDPAMITAQRIQLYGREILIGLNSEGNENQRLTLNILHWLSKLM